MRKLYLFSFIHETVVNGHDTNLEKILILFCPYKEIGKHLNEVYNELRNYFQRNILPNKIVVICSKFNEDEIVEVFDVDSELYDYIPLFRLDEAFENISINSLQDDGNYILKRGFAIEKKFLKYIFNRGMVKIFNENGGLIVSQSAHHFVFPSGKHSDRFLRSGNVLIKGTQIKFIAFALYNHFGGKKFTNIYSDTSSINSLAYAYNILSREFDSGFDASLHIESFGSYQGFESGKFSAPKECMFLISSSTSGSIIERMISDKKSVMEESNICIIYGLDVEPAYSKRVICDLAIDISINPEGLKKFESYNVTKGQACKFCENKSKAVEVKGDVFLLEKPVINGRLLGKADFSTTLKSFSEYFSKGADGETLIRAFFKENSSGEKKYEIFIDIEELLKHWTKRSGAGPFEKIFIKLEKYIIQNIPASLKYLIVLPDAGSSILADIIVDVLKNNGITFPKDHIIQTDDIERMEKRGKGTVVIVSSSITTGHNLLFISRALREFEDHYQRIYFTLINRASNLKHYEFLESNLSFGEFGKGTHKLINVERILCPHDGFDTPWHVERDFLKKLSEFFEATGDQTSVIDYCEKRIDELNNSGNVNGLSDNLFFDSFKNKKLKIRKGFVFAPNQQKFIKEASQADIYFIVCTILNEIRSNGDLDQSEYVRNLLEPGNFVRFNDGIIQAALLRGAKYDELRYDLSEFMSSQMFAILGDMINHLEDEHAEGIEEFFYAIAIKKLRLTHATLQGCVELVRAEECLKEGSFLEALVKYIEATILKEKKMIEINLQIVPEDEEV